MLLNDSELEKAFTPLIPVHHEIMVIKISVILHKKRHLIEARATMK